MISSPDASTPSELETTIVPQEAREINLREVREIREDSPFFKEFCEKLASFATPEEKIAHALQFMKGAISQEGSPRFREFWEARRAALPFFKENLNASIRSKLWNEYVELTVEARRLKEILEEQSAFAMEQIDLAVQSIEADLGNFEAILATTPALVFPEGSQTMAQKAEKYNRIQRELSLFNTLAGKLNALRKEIIKTDMRIRFKTKFFKRLSDLGDKVFPKRKELIEQVSAEFEKDIDSFVSKYFQGEAIVGAPYYALREEIKALQVGAKLFTLNSGAFTRTRLKLSECWDKVKVLEKEHKKEVLEKRAATSEKVQEVQAKIVALKDKELSFEALNKELDLISSEMRNIQLQREDVQFLRGEMQKMKEPYFAAQEAKLKAMEEAEKEKLRVKRESLAALKDKIANVTKDAEKMEMEVLATAFAEIEADLAKIEPSKIDRQQIERTLRQLKDLLADKKERSLLNLSDDDKKALETLRTILQQKKQRRTEIKDQLEQYRKALGGSGLDFEKAMQYQELVEQEKERLEKANAGMQEIEQKISALES